MKNKILRAVSMASLAWVALEGQEAVGPPAYTTQFVAVEEGVKLEVVDWGGSGRPLVLLAGLGATAHVYDQFAAKLATNYHVYGITRRGFGASSVPLHGYSADRLGDDVLAVIDSLHLDRPILVGNSIAGEELSSVGSRHPEKVAALVYLEAGYSYAFYSRSPGDQMTLLIDSSEFKRDLEQLPGSGPNDQKRLVDEMLKAIPLIKEDLEERQEALKAVPPSSSASEPQAAPAAPTPTQAIYAGMQKYTDIHVPTLAIFSIPHAFSGMFENDPAGRAKAEADDVVLVGSVATAFESGVASSRVVRIAHATHAVFMSNEADVLREMNLFIGGLTEGIASDPAIRKLKELKERGILTDEEFQAEVRKVLNKK